jgi:hypothetical protein
MRAAVSCIVLVLCTPLVAQWLNYPTPGVPRTKDGKPNLSAPAPRTADGKPDLSGLWETETAGGTSAPVAGAASLPPEFINIAAKLKGGLPYQKWARDLKDARLANEGKDNPDGHCQPLSILHLHTHPFPRKILQVPGLIAILYEKNVDYRQIFTDGRPLPDDPSPSFFGSSKGKWEGNTLVVQTIGFRDGLWADADGNPLTESAKITERFRRPNYGHLEIEVTVDDPKAYTATWTVKLSQHIKLDTDLMEYFCENEKDLQHLVGK